MSVVRNSRAVTLYSVVAGICAVLFSPLLAMAYFATAEGAEELEIGTISAWAEPGRDLAGSLLTFASPDGVYKTYTLIFALLFPAVILAHSVVRSQRPTTQTKPERWGWRLTRVGYIMFGTGLVIVAVALFVTASDSPIVDGAFMGLMFPGLLLSLIGSGVLGVALLRAGYRPRLAAWLLALAFPLWIVGDFIIGHNSIGLVPLFVAWATSSAALRGAESPALAGPVQSGAI
jgi:hypothetical protein